MNLNQQADYGTRKLAHYKKWLLDPTRPIGVPYSGFPEDLIKPKGKKMQSPAIAQVAATLSGKKGPAIAAPIKKASKRSTGAKVGTKSEAALAIYTRHSGDKNATIAAIQSDLGMSLAGATTYYYNAKKASR